MATLVLGAAGAAVGGALGGGVLGISGAVIGRALGASLGRVIDERLLGASAPVESGGMDRLHVAGAGEGDPIPRVWGQMRVAGHVIWAGEFRQQTVAGGGKGGGGGGGETELRVSLALGLCEGPIAGIGRIWADGTPLEPTSIDLRVYPGDEAQLPDPLIEAVEGAENAPAYRGLAYVVIEDLDLGRFGNRIPQLWFEVLRRADVAAPAHPADVITGVALIPGTGEYALATTPVTLGSGPGQGRRINVNTPSGRSDLETSLDALARELPGARSVSLVVSWFGDDLAAGRCTVAPRVEGRDREGLEMPWRVSGLTRAEAREVGRVDGRPAFGGTPCDHSVIEAIRAIHAAGREVMFYPFVLMDIQAGNGLPDPWSGAADQPVMPWRGRITASVAPGRPGSPEGTAAADAEVAAFFGQAAPGDFVPGPDGVDYVGPQEWSYRRFVLHYAHLCAVAGGVEAFCIGSELRGLTQLRGAAGFPAVEELRRLAADVRQILGPDVKIGYAADWSEYFGYHPSHAPGDVWFNLDPLWADDNIDFIGIDNYMPLSDWRDEPGHADESWGSIYDLDYLKANVAGGEGYDWYYPTEEARKLQQRVPIRDEAHGEHWIWRCKDLVGWWSNPHHERVGGQRAAAPTAWVPRSKPIWFTEVGCPAVDKGTNQPNVFVDPKSSESALPHFSTGQRDDLIQQQYLLAMHQYWSDPANNPVSPIYGGSMVDTARIHVWAWDARPWPAFPADAELWSDGGNWRLGHWISGRVEGEPLPRVVAEICAKAGVGAEDLDLSELAGVVRGYRRGRDETARAALQPLMMVHGFDALERGGRLAFVMRARRALAPPAAELAPEALAVPRGGAAWEALRAGAAERRGRVRLVHLADDSSYDQAVADARRSDDDDPSVEELAVALRLTGEEARAVAERWLAEAEAARDGLRLHLPPAATGLLPGDVITWSGGGKARRYRITRRELADVITIEAVRVEPGHYRAVPATSATAPGWSWRAPVPPALLFLDLPLIRGDEVPHAPRVAVAANPWSGPMALWSAAQDAGYAFERRIDRPAVIGRLVAPLAPARPWLWDEGNALEVELIHGALASASAEAVLDGANVAAVGGADAVDWEVIQFREAEPLGGGRWRLRGILRGQAGSEPRVLPRAAGSWFVLLDGRLPQLDISPAARNRLRHVRVGPAGRAPDDPAFVHAAAAFVGVGLRPLAPVHLRARADGAGGHVITWVRRSRIGGDDWELPEIPLGEARPLWQLEIRVGGAVVRRAECSETQFHYDAASQSADGIAGGFEVAVAQVSDMVGPGDEARVTING